MQTSNKSLHPADENSGLLIKTIATVLAVRLGLWLLPFTQLRRVLSSLSKAPCEQIPANPGLVNRIVEAVKTASYLVPGATCLTQALATKLLLGRCGQPARLRIGVSRGAGREFTAHAWVESNGIIVIGNQNSSVNQFSLLPLDDKEIV